MATKSKISVPSGKKDKQLLRPAILSSVRKAAPKSKQSIVLSMLETSAGATIEALMKRTGWQAHSVRGFLSGVVRKKLKLNLSSKMVDGDRVYLVANKASRGLRREA